MNVIPVTVEPAEGVGLDDGLGDMLGAALASGVGLSETAVVGEAVSDAAGDADCAGGCDGSAAADGLGNADGLGDTDGLGDADALIGGVSKKAHSSEIECGHGDARCGRCRDRCRCDQC